MKDLFAMLGLAEPQLNLDRLTEAVESLVGPHVDQRMSTEQMDRLVLGAVQMLLEEAPTEFLTQPAQLASRFPSMN